MFKKEIFSYLLLYDVICDITFGSPNFLPKNTGIAKLAVSFGPLMLLNPVKLLSK